MDEVCSVSGGEDPDEKETEVVVVTGIRRDDDSGGGSLGPIFTGFELSMISGGSSGAQATAQRQAEFLRNVIVERLPNGDVRVTFLRDVTFSANVPTVGNVTSRQEAGSQFTGRDQTGGSRGRPNNIPDVIDRALSYSGGVTWGN
jgi:hypothetical protein